MSESPRSCRREFIKTLTLLSATSTLLGKTWITNVLAQQMPDGVLRLKLSDFPALQTDFGSVRIATSALVPSGGIPGCTRPAGLFYPVIINRGPGGVFYAFSAECTHEGCTVPAYDSAIGSMRCPGHGSRFAIDGSVIVGPALSPLISYTVRLDEAGTLAVESLDWSFYLTTLGVPSGAGDRFALNFVAFTDIEYEVRFRETLDSSDRPVNFALTTGGPADRTFLLGTGEFVTVYVDRVAPTGFYSISMRIREG